MCGCFETSFKIEFEVEFSIYSILLVFCDYRESISENVI